MTGMPWWLVSVIGVLLLISLGIGAFLWWMLRHG